MIRQELSISDQYSFNIVKNGCYNLSTIPGKIQLAQLKMAVSFSFPPDRIFDKFTEAN